jgi:cell wall assembly regulator SMI1
MRATELWTRYTTWLEKNAPASRANLAPPASGQDIAALERRIGVELPDDVHGIWMLNDGQRDAMIATRLSPATVCLPTLSFLSTKLVADVWGEWETLRQGAGVAELDAACRSSVPGVVRPLYTHPRWIPLWSDPTRPDYIGLDLAPDERGTPGQVINFGRNEDTHYCCARSFTELLEILVEEVESGAWPASEMGYGDRSIPWLGEPKASFFNALSARAERANPQPVPLGQQLSAAVREGRAALVRGDLEDAKAAIARARALKERHAPTEGLLVEVLVAAGDRPGAQAAFDELIGWAPRFPDAQALQKLLRAER